MRFVRVAEDGPGDVTTVLATAGDALLAIGGTRGVRVADAGELPEAWLRRGPVLDLAFLDPGALIVATAEGLYRVERDGQVVREHLAPGSAVQVRRLAAARGTAVAAADSGVYVREGGARWRRVRGLPRQPASLVALREQPDRLELWALLEGELWTARVQPGDTVEVDEVTRAALPTVRRPDPAEDLRFELPGASAVLLFPDSLAVRDGEGRWRTLRPSLPPGSRATRLAFAHERFWLATDAGLLSAPRLEGPWLRAEPPFGTTSVAALAGDGHAIWFAARGRVMRSAEEPYAARLPQLAGTGSDVAPALEPSIDEVQRVVLDYVDLDPERVRALRRGAETRGWLPELLVTAGYDRDRDHNRDYDQALVSGQMHELFDRERDQGDALDFGVALSWDFGDTRFHPEEIDVLRETRAVIALRDDVLDEVTQIYFERRRVLADLARLGEAAPEAMALATRVEELRAGLDAWTGGWFTRRTRALARGPNGSDTPQTKE